jgi:hypothetical protein
MRLKGMMGRWVWKVGECLGGIWFGWDIWGVYEYVDLYKSSVAFLRIYNDNE